MLFFYSLCVFVGWLIGAFLKIAILKDKRYFLAALILTITYLFIASILLLFIKKSQTKKGIDFSIKINLLGWILLFLASIGAGLKTPVR